MEIDNIFLFVKKRRCGNVVSMDEWKREVAAERAMPPRKFSSLGYIRKLSFHPLISKEVRSDRGVCYVRETGSDFMNEVYLWKCSYGRLG